MINEPLEINTNQAYALWQKLTYELADIFDPHGVYAIVANQIALYTGTTTVVGVTGLQGTYYDVWVCTGEGSIKQTRWDSAKASFEPLIEAGQAMLHDKFSLPPAELINSELWRLPRESVLAVPLPIRGRYNPLAPPGILCLVDPASGCALTLENIEPLAANITIFLDRAYLRNQVHRQDVIFSVVSDISYSLTSTLSMQKIFQQLMDPVRRTLNVESISVGLIEPASGDIEFVDILMGPLFRDLPPIRLKRGQGIAGWVVDHCEPVIVNDAYSDSRFYSQIDHRSGFHTGSMICIPLQVEERVIGVLQAINKEVGNFNDNDLRLLQAIGGPLAAAIENAQLHADVIAEKRRIETIFANMSEGLLTVNAEGRITQANDSLLTLLRKEPDELVGRMANKIIHLESGNLDEFISNLVETSDEYPQLATDLFQSRQQSVPVLISGAPIKDEQGDVSEMILVFSDLRQIREVERMRDDFFHGIVHELRTPLATILMYARLLREGKAREKEKADRFLGVIERESDRLQKMVRQMLQLAKLESREFQRSAELVSINSLFVEMLPPLADQATEKGLTFRQRIASDLPQVRGSHETLYLIFKNLIDNAIKFTPSGTIMIDAWHEGSKIHVSVKDDGIGIPQQAMPNLFGRFFRSQTAVERGIAGTGLGLYMVKESVEKYNGTIDVASDDGKGTTFTVSLPAASD
jgi:two-component system phosphate regulon sensor histidine kinase PhoR